MGFKDRILADRAVFLNPDEFGGTHQIQYRPGHGPEPIVATVDSERLAERASKEYNGLFIGELLYFAAVDDFAIPITKDQRQLFDGEPYTVVDVRAVDGMYEIILNEGA